MNDLLLEMQSILGHEIEELPVHDPSPREVVGTFAVYGASMIDEVVWESISHLEWDEVMDVALLSTIEFNDFHKLSKAYSEGASVFREVWNELQETEAIAPEVNRGMFIHVMNDIQQAEARSRYVYWCAQTLHEAGPGTKANAIKKSNKFNNIIPVGSAAEHAKNVEAAQKYMTPHNAGSDKPEAGNEVMRNNVFHGQDDSNAPLDRVPPAEGMKAVIKAQEKLSKLAADAGTSIDLAFPQLFSRLGTERARNS